MLAQQRGLEVRADRLTFENIDFVPDDTAATGAAGDAAGSTLVRLTCPECSFVGCSFQSLGRSPDFCTAIRWLNDDMTNAATALPAGRIRVENCVFRRLAAGINSSRRGAIALRVANTLHLGPGPFVRVGHPPAADEPINIVLSQTTLRDASAMLEILWRDGPGPATGEVPVGEIGIDASACAFAPRDGYAILLLLGGGPSPQLMHGLKWTGRGSVVGPQTAFARWQRGDRDSRIIDDAALNVSGLVRGRINFSGECDGQPSNSRIAGCQAPLEDSDSLGASAASLPPDIGPDNQAPGQRSR